MNEITLPHANNTIIPIQDLISYFREKKLNYLIIGARFVVLEHHPYTYSLDVWLRKHPKIVGYENTCQAVKDVIHQIIKHPQFSKGFREDPKNGSLRKALVFCDNQINLK